MKNIRFTVRTENYKGVRYDRVYLIRPSSGGGFGFEFVPEVGPHADASPSIRVAGVTLIVEESTQ